jgi:Cft2 family RNA processing exonuclease
MMSGWALLKGAHFRYGVEHVLPLSDHADFDELIELIDRVRPKKILTVHGFPDFVQTLRKRGLDASLARPEAQMNLFE